MKYGVGQPVPRSEDRRFLTRGGAAMSTTSRWPRMAHGVVLRSPYAHARIAGIDASCRSCGARGPRRANGRGLPGGRSGLDTVPLDRRRDRDRPRAARAHPPPSRSTPHAMSEPRWLSSSRRRATGRSTRPSWCRSTTRSSRRRSTPPRPPDPPRSGRRAPDNRCFAVEMGDREAVEAAFAAAHRVARIAPLQQPDRRGVDGAARRGRGIRRGRRPLPAPSELPESPSGPPAARPGHVPHPRIPPLGGRAGRRLAGSE